MYKIRNQTIFNSDYLENTEKTLFDLTITSPPYNLDLSYGEYNDNVTYQEYLDFSKNWLEKVYHSTKTRGRLCINVPIDTNKGGIRPIYADLLNTAKNIGWQYRHTILWFKGLSGTAWGSWLSPNAPNIQTLSETIIVMFKDEWNLGRTNKSDLTKFEFMEWTQGIWVFRGESRKKNSHPAAFPISLPLRCIKLFSYPGDNVLDCFMGSGTTLFACDLLDRNGFGYEVEKKYCKGAYNRLLTGKFQSEPLKEIQMSIFDKGVF